MEILLKTKNKSYVKKQNYLFSFYGFCYKKNYSIRYLVIFAFGGFLSLNTLEFGVIPVHLATFGRIDLITRFERYCVRRIRVSSGGSRTGDFLFLCVYLIGPGWLFLLFLNIIIIYYLNIFSVYYGLSGVITVINVFLDFTFYISNINVCIWFYL